MRVIKERRKFNYLIIITLAIILLLSIIQVKAHLDLLNLLGL